MEKPKLLESFVVLPTFLAKPTKQPVAKPTKQTVKNHSRSGMGSESCKGSRNHPFCRPSLPQREHN